MERPCATAPIRPTGQHRNAFAHRPRPRFDSLDFRYSRSRSFAFVMYSGGKYAIVRTPCSNVGGSSTIRLAIHSRTVFADTPPSSFAASAIVLYVFPSFKIILVANLLTVPTILTVLMVLRVRTVRTLNKTVLHQIVLLVESFLKLLALPFEPVRQFQLIHCSKQS